MDTASASISHLPRNPSDRSDGRDSAAWRHRTELVVLHETSGLPDRPPRFKRTKTLTMLLGQLPNQRASVRSGTGSTPSTKIRSLLYWSVDAARFVAEELASFGVNHIEIGIAGTGIVAFGPVEGGDGPRADMEVDSRARDFGSGSAPRGCLAPQISERVGIMHVRPQPTSQARQSVYGVG